MQAEDVLRKLIAREEYRNGKLLPKEVDLAQQLGMSRNTLRQAIDRLVFEGLLERRRGYGTRVIRQSLLVGVKNWHSFSQEMKLLGVEIHNYELRISRQNTPLEVCEFFNSKEDEKHLVLERIRGNEEFPFVYFISFFNPAIPLTGEENFNRPLYDILDKDFGIVVKSSKEEISASLAGEKIAEKLGVKATDPILIRKRRVLDTNGEPVEYNIGYYRADKFKYTVEGEK